MIVNEMIWASMQSACTHISFLVMHQHVSYLLVLVKNSTSRIYIWLHRLYIIGPDGPDASQVVLCMQLVSSMKVILSQPLSPQHSVVKTTYQFLQLYNICCAV